MFELLRSLFRIRRAARSAHYQALYALGVSALAFGCTNGEAPDVGPGSVNPAGGAGSSAGQPGSANAGTQSGGGFPGGGAATMNCSPQADVGFAPLARLTRTEYNNAARDVLGDTSSPAANFVSDDTLGLFEANISASVQDTMVSAYMTSAETVAAGVKARLGSLVPCAANQTDAACAQQVIDILGLRLYRRPLQASESAAYVTLFNQGSSAQSFAHGAELVVQAMLQSPYFLYHVEVGAGAGPVQDLTAYELASRLSFFLWESAPDESLLTAAKSAQLGTAQQVEMQARRLLADPRAAAMTRRFYRQWLRVSQLDHLVTDPAAVASMGQELDAFIDQVTWKEGGTVDALFNSTTAFLDANTRKFYGVTDPAAPAATQTQYKLNESERSGLLTRAPFLAANLTVPARGKFVTNQLLCRPVPDPDPALMVQPFEPDPSMPERAQWGMHESSPACRACHAALDPVGFGFLHYDKTGKYRALDRQFMIDSSGALSSGQPDIDGQYDGAIDLSKRLAKSDAVRSCMTDIWFTVALDRQTRDQDTCAKQQILQSFIKSNGSVPELMVALATSPAFSHRRTASQ